MRCYIIKLNIFLSGFCSLGITNEFVETSLQNLKRKMLHMRFKYKLLNLKSLVLCVCMYERV